MVINLGVGVFNLQRDEQSPWAAKIINRHTGRDRKHYSNRLHLEAKVLSSLDHPNIIGYRAFVKRPDGREVSTYTSMYIHQGYFTCYPPATSLYSNFSKSVVMVPP